MKSSPLALAAILLVPLSASTQTPTASTKGALGGIVLKAASGEPLEGATLTLQHWYSQDPWRKVVSGRDGGFSFGNLEPGEYELQVEREGYLTMWYGQRFPGDLGTRLILEPGRKLTDIRFRMFPAAVISGRVTDENGEPVTSVTVSALGYTRRGCRRQWMNATSPARTDAQGAYRLSGLEPGRYLLAASYGTYVAGFFKVKRTYAPTYYPGTREGGRAEAVEVGLGGELAGVDFTLVPETGPTVSIRGLCLHGEDGVPTPCVPSLSRVESESEFPEWPTYTVKTDEDGSFQLGSVTPGSYVLFADCVYKGKTYRARAPIEIVDSDIDNLKLELIPAAELRGRVRIEGETAVKLTDLTVAVSAVGGVNLTGDQASPSPDGSFIIENVSDGRYRLEVFGAPRNFYVKAATLGNQDTLEKVFNFDRSQSSAHLGILLSPSAGRIDGTVLKENQPWDRALVILVQSTSREGLCTPARAFSSPDTHGNFSLESIPPGDYKLFAFESVEEAWNEDADFFGPYASLGVPVHVDPSSRLRVPIKLIPSGKENH
jgi:hypothetical protein